MLWQMIKKELLMIWRRPRELIVLLLMPFVLITILGSALGALNNNEEVEVTAKLAVVVEDEADQAQQQVIEKIRQSNAAEQKKAANIALIESLEPINIFINVVGKSPELKKVLSITEYRNIKEVKEKDYDGVLLIPEGFTTKFYNNLLEKNTTIPAWILKTKDEQSLRATIIQDIITNYQKEWVYQKTAQDLQIDYSALVNTNIYGQIENIEKKKEISAFAYYGVGMCVMFVFYISTTVAGFAFQQKEELMYERILLANVPKIVFFTGVFMAAFILSLLQLTILFSLTALIYGVVFPSIINHLFVTLTVSIMAATFATFTTAVAFATNSRNVESIFSSLIVPILAFIGGSFFNVSAIGGFMETLGEYSPGGAALTAYLKVYQGYSLGDIWSQLRAILLFSVLLLLLSVVTLKKRGGIR
ncbi:ABC transporter permease [Cytobacillus oceanisediminis]|uniref:ABC transporter permease n=1 Tax=Niallia alba TaxID=2729105 RepID=A0A7Y0K6L0_9BACI|nr:MULTISPECIES: ABC transporter permease [Bacillaceae]MBQ6447903.1 ABC transporter permease [Bacillus sp. (in: firmicutes)]MBZ9533158.1 ABC transporter permease [Cytobacillus oceanisediminis]NMO76718.1 ABC transporter permease [Niallia alba]UTI39916.1 ABC transporter permease [Niallia sp. RD1]